MQTIDGNLLFTFTERDTTGGGSVQLLKVDTLANVLWQTTLVNQPFISSSVCQFPNGEIISCYGNNKLEKFDSFGNSLWIGDLAALPTQNFSTFETRSIFPVSNFTFLISSSESVSAPGGSWLTITKVVDTTLTSVPEMENYPFYIYPNPTISSFTLDNISMDSKLLMQILNYQGIIMYSEELYGSNKYNFQPNLSRGIYFVRLMGEKHNFVKKLVVE